MNKQIYLREWVRSFRFTNPWKLFRKESLPEYFVSIYEGKNGVNLLPIARKLYRKEIYQDCLLILMCMTAVITIAFLAGMLFGEDIDKENMMTVIAIAGSVCVASALGASRLGKGIKNDREIVDDFQRLIYELAKHMDPHVICVWVESQKEGFKLRDLNGQLIRRALEVRQSQLALNLRHAEIVRDEGLTRPLPPEYRIFDEGESTEFCIERHRKSLSEASKAMETFGLGLDWKFLFQIANREIQLENEERWEKAPDWVI